MRHEQKWPRALGGASAAGKPVHHQYSRLPAPVPSPALRMGGYWLACGEKTLSAIYRAMTDTPGPLVRAILDRAAAENLTITPDLFASAAQGNLLRVLVGLREAGLRPTPRLVLRMAQHLGWPIVDDGGDECACLVRVLECESSAAGLITWAAHLRECALRRRMTRDLAATHARVVNPRDAVADIIGQCAANIDAWRDDLRRGAA